MFNNKIVFYLHGNANDHSEGFAAYIEHFLSAIEKIIANEADALSSTFLPGLAAMPNIHPLIVHFPIAFLTAFFFLDVAGTLTQNKNWRKLASVLLYFGVVAVLCAVAAGFQAAETIPHGGAVHKIMEKHEHLGLSVAFLTVTLALWRIIAGEKLKPFANFLHLAIAALIVFVMTIGVDLGGLMVYKYGVGVGVDAFELREDEGINLIPHEHNHDHHQH